MEADDGQYLDALSLARDLCTGIAAFFASPSGLVVVSVSLSPNIQDAEPRVRALARACLEHPFSQGRELFANAELTGEGMSDDDSLACVALPVWSEDTWLGLIGVVDTWLPDLDEEQRFGLQRIGNILVRRLAGGPGTSRPPEPPGRPSPGPQAQSPRSEGSSWTSGHAETPAESESLVEEIVNVLPEGLIVAREDGTIVYINETFAEMNGVDPSEVLGSDVAALFSPNDDQMLVAAEGGDFSEYLVGTGSPGRRLLLTAGNGTSFPVDVSGRRVTLSSVGECFVTQLRDASHPVADAELAGVREWSLETALDSLDEGIVVCDALGVVRFSNRAGRVMQGLSPDDDLTGHPFPAATGLFHANGSRLTLDQHPLTRALRGTVIRGEQLLSGSEESSRRHVLASAQPLSVSGTNGALLVIRDVTTQTVEEARLTHLALHDPLTGLANRHLLLDYLRRILGDFRSRGGIVALIFLDLDDFKEINDKFGHDVGDEVLVAVGRRMQGAVRSSDIVARLGGDEFVVAHAASGDPGELCQVVSRIRKTLSVPYQVRGHMLVVTCSIGWVVADPRNDDPLDLLVRADREMYRSKRSRMRREGSE